ncbi:uncharacterized protein [Pyrus communis]|uniref:uncharacterized protein n=1 Tax=Pyrus communis TaxID=23211 RepID=UPI0035C24900
MEDGKVPMPWVIKAKINQDIDSHLRDSIKGHSHHHNSHHNLPNQIQGLQKQAKEMDEVKKKIGQMAEFIGQFREQGKLPSSTIVDLNEGFETANTITLRSGKEIGTSSKTSKSTQDEDEKLLQQEEIAITRKEHPLPQHPKHPMPSNSTKVGPNSIPSDLIPPNVPFSGRFMQSRNKANEKDILETFRKMQVNILLLDAIKQISKYAKFFKKLCTTKKQILEKQVVHVSENVSAMLQRKLPPKCKDPGELKNDGFIIQLADRSNAYPKGVLEDVLVQVNHLIFPADFYVLEMEDSTHSPHYQSYLDDLS